MSLKNFNHWVTQLNHLDFTLSEKEEKIIQITDLNRFIECYDPSLEIIDCLNFDFCLVEKNNIEKKVYLSDLSNIDTKTVNLLETTENHNNESWFILVNDKLNSALKLTTKLIEDNQIRNFYDKVFVFNFFQSSILEIK